MSSNSKLQYSYYPNREYILWNSINGQHYSEAKTDVKYHLEYINTRSKLISKEYGDLYDVIFIANPDFFLIYNNG